MQCRGVELSILYTKTQSFTETERPGWRTTHRIHLAQIAIELRVKIFCGLKSQLSSTMQHFLFSFVCGMKSNICIFQHSNQVLVLASCFITRKLHNKVQFSPGKSVRIFIYLSVAMNSCQILTVSCTDFKFLFVITVCIMNEIFVTLYIKSLGYSVNKACLNYVCPFVE